MDRQLEKTVQSQMCAGTWNLLHNCADVQPGEKLLLVCENSSLGWYDNSVAEIIESAITKFDISPTVFHVDEPTNQPVPDLDDAIAKHDCVIYLARMGDQSRFDKIAPGKRSVMCYIRDKQMLGSPLCQMTYQAIKTFKNAIDDILLEAKTIEITCPLGTSLIGSTTTNQQKKKIDVSVLRFPLGVPQPLTTVNCSGQVAISRFLTPTGSKVYEPASIPLEKTTFAQITQGRITGFEGDPKEVKLIQDHYDNVAKRFGIDRDIVHSWHAGIHPACAYTSPASQNPDRWSNTVFGNPRILHFHTCGNYAPAEICWIIVDQTIIIDGIALWNHGRLCPENFEKTRTCLNEWPQLKELFEHPAQEIGVATPHHS